VSDKLLHLVRHGEVHNPDGVLYGRLPEYRLSELGQSMAEAAALDLAGSDRIVRTLIASPLERTQQSAKPIAQALSLEIGIDPRIIEPTNHFEGLKNSGPDAAFRHPKHWPAFINPFRPSWGEPYRAIATRMREAMNDAWDSTEGGDIVFVSHQSPIWVTHLDVAGKALFHDPRSRRCELSSITTFERRGERWFEVDYRTPAAEFVAGAKDVGAV
jgi:broad specificity phosphatase PhoE